MRVTKDSTHLAQGNRWVPSLGGIVGAVLWGLGRPGFCWSSVPGGWAGGLLGHASSWCGLSDGSFGPRDCSLQGTELLHRQVLSTVPVIQSINSCGHYRCVQIRLGIFSVQVHPWSDAPFYFTECAKPCCFPTPFLSSLPLLRLGVSDWWRKQHADLWQSGVYKHFVKRAPSAIFSLPK